MSFLQNHPVEWIREEYNKWTQIQGIKEHQLDILDRELSKIGDLEKIRLVFKLIDGLNPEQMEATLHNHSKKGPLLILAGAGSGKTATLTRRVVYLLINEIYPQNILCMTFTNKAAGEMRERINILLQDLLNYASPELSYIISEIIKHLGEMWVSTFHSCCLRLLKDRIEGTCNLERVGLPEYVSIIEPIEQKELVKTILKKLNIPYKELEPEDALSAIGIAKNDLKSVQVLEDEAETEDQIRIAKVYKSYQNELLTKQVIDFDDMILYSAQILVDFPDILEHYRNLFRYCLIDEYQDTNMAQYVFTINIVEKHRRLFAVGDDDQSIYGWRGADIRNILNFRKDFPDCKIIRMEKNYRSAGNILLAANEIFQDKDPEYRKVLKVTDRGKSASEKYGERIILFQLRDEIEEAEFVAFEVKNLVETEDMKYSDFAVLYRTNEMRTSFIDMFIEKGIPYIELGNSENLKQKDILQFFEFCSIFSDFVPILNMPEKVGESFKAQIDTKIINAFALPVFKMNDNDLTQLRFLPNNPLTGKPYNIYNIFTDTELYNRITGSLSSKGKQVIDNIYSIFSDLIGNFNQYTLYGFLLEILTRCGFGAEIRAGGDRHERKKLIESIVAMAARQEEVMSEDTPTYERLRLFLEDIKEKMHGTQTECTTVKDGVKLMTLHSAKGLEFRNVFFAGLDEGICPHEHPSEKNMSEDDKKKRIDEERRLFYVGVTRAMERLYLLHTLSRNRFGKRIKMKPSRFIKLLPQDLIEKGETVSGISDKLKEKTRFIFSKIFE